MNILAGLETFLYVISSALFYPVVAGLVLLTFWVVISFGSFLREYLERRQGESSALMRYKKSLRLRLHCRISWILSLKDFYRAQSLNSLNPSIKSDLLFVLALHSD